MTTNAQARKEAIEKQIRQRVALEEKAFRIVEKLLNNPISPKLLCESAYYIQTLHYKDIVEERAIGCLCGWPICDNVLENIQEKKYHISLKQKQVFDITERKNFCDDICFLTSRKFQSSLSDTPVWLRENEDLGPFTIPVVTRGILGDQMFNKPAERLFSELCDLNQNEDYVEAKDTTKCPKIEILPAKKSILKKITKHHSPASNVSDTPPITCSSPSASTVTPTLEPTHASTPSPTHETSFSGSMQAIAAQVDGLCLSEPQKCSRSSSDLVVRLHSAQNSKSPTPNHRSTITPNSDSSSSASSSTSSSATTSTTSVRVIEPKTPNSSYEVEIKENSSKSVDFEIAHHSEANEFAPPHGLSSSHVPSRLVKQTPSLTITDVLVQWKTKKTIEFYGIIKVVKSERHKKEMSLNNEDDDKKVSTGNKENDKIDNTMSSNEKYDKNKDGEVVSEKKIQLSEEQLLFAEKVAMFYGEKPKKRELSKKDHLEDNKKSKDQEVQIPERVFPFIDNQNQVSLRRNIVYEKLGKVIPNLLSKLSLSVTLLNDLLTPLISTFRLTESNTVLKPHYWKLLALIIVKSVVHMNFDLQQRLLEPEAQVCIHQETFYLDLEPEQLCRIVHFLHSSKIKKIPKDKKQ